MKNRHTSNLSTKRAMGITHAQRQVVQFALTTERTCVSVPNTSEALCATGLALFGAGLLMAILTE